MANLRAMPRPGGRVLIDYLGSTVGGVVREVADEGRRLQVVTDEGATLVFALNGATATFTQGGSQTGPRLRFT
jgi:hypothetical protein